MHTVSILGVGRAGGALALALSYAGNPLGQLIYNTRQATLPGLALEQVPYRQVSEIRGDVIVIATADPDIFPVATRLASLRRIPPVALHLSGSLSSEELYPLRSRNVAVGSMHPLVSISTPIAGASRFEGGYFCVEGESAAVEAAMDLVTQLGGKAFTIETELKPLYHASAVMASGNVTALFDAALEMLSKCGLERSEARTILLPLLRSTVANLTEQSTETALTGPFARGDADALLRHLNAFDGTVSDELREIYLLLAERSVEIAARVKGREDRLLAEAISVAKRKTEC